MASGSSGVRGGRDRYLSSLAVIGCQLLSNSWRWKIAPSRADSSGSLLEFCWHSCIQAITPNVSSCVKGMWQTPGSLRVNVQLNCVHTAAIGALLSY